MSNNRIVCFFLLIGCLSVGCGGPPAGELTGRVTFEGTPLTSGTITLVPVAADGEYAHAEIQEDGTYVATTDKSGTRIPLGQYRVMISATKDMGPEAPVEPLLPLRFSSDVQSKLTTDVAEGENVQNFDLES